MTWRTRVVIDGKREDQFFTEREHCEVTASFKHGTTCKELQRRGGTEAPYAAHGRTHEPPPQEAPAR